MRRLETIPGLGWIRAAQVVAVVVTPHRFRTKRQFWSYCGLAVVSRSGADWVPGPNGGWRRRTEVQMRGLNRNRNPLLRCVFKGAAMTVIQKLPVTRFTATTSDWSRRACAPPHAPAAPSSRRCSPGIAACESEAAETRGPQPRARGSDIQG